MKRKIEAFDYAKDILEAVGKGVLMTTCADGKVDTMTIGWGTMGIQWGKPIFIAYVRESRFTKELVDKNGEFTVNVPYGQYDKNILGFCGTKSGRNVDKIKELGLTLEAGETVSVPAIKELPLTLECKVIYKQEQNKDAIAPFAMERYYGDGDFHTAYYGQITAAYIVE
ncbi:MAG: flavin reductase family protein [Ruminococcaceae bacterium]|nr:flavin reductase family protein [Oscillospiraceae bacterium]